MTNKEMKAIIVALRAELAALKATPPTPPPPPPPAAFVPPPLTEATKSMLAMGYKPYRWRGYISWCRHQNPPYAANGEMHAFTPVHAWQWPACEDYVNIARAIPSISIIGGLAGDRKLEREALGR